MLDGRQAQDAVRDRGDKWSGESSRESGRN